MHSNGNRFGLCHCGVWQNASQRTIPDTCSQTGPTHCFHQCGIKPIVLGPVKSLNINTRPLTCWRPHFASARPGCSSKWYISDTVDLIPHQCQGSCGPVCAPLVAKAILRLFSLAQVHDSTDRTRSCTPRKVARRILVYNTVPHNRTCMGGTRHHCRTRLSLVRRGPTFLQPQGHRNQPFALAPQRALSQKQDTQHRPHDHRGTALRSSPDQLSHWGVSSDRTPWHAILLRCSAWCTERTGRPTVSGPPPHALSHYATLTAIFRGCTSGALGRCTVSTPCFSAAAMLL